MSRTILDPEFGVTIKDLKEYVKDLPETDENGEDYEMWVENENGTSNMVKSIWPLNSGDILIKNKRK